LSKKFKAQQEGYVLKNFPDNTSSLTSLIFPDISLTIFECLTFPGIQIQEIDKPVVTSNFALQLWLPPTDE
jgi:hypothetical protein